MSAGVPRKEAETSAGAHAITRWLGIDSPDDTSPHTRQVRLDEDGWLLVCSDGLWNYCSEAADLQRLVHERAAGTGPHPPTLAQALVEFANGSGGADNVTVALVRVGAVEAGPAPAHTASTPTGEPADHPTELETP